MACLVALWHIEDFNAGLVTRCAECYLPYGEIAEAYGQSARARCPTCFGTTFQGGFRARVYRPTMFGPVEQSDDGQKHGVTKRVSATIHTTSDVQLRDGDIIIRRNGTRWQISSPSVQEITTGFGPSYDQIDRSSLTAFREDPTSPAFLIPVDGDALAAVGWMPYMPYPTGADSTPGPIVYEPEEIP
jgi:hypothetical protein